MDARYTGEQIAAARRAKGLTQKQLADALGVTDKAVSKWERGEFPIVKDTTPNMMNPRLNITSKQNTGCSNQMIACIRYFVV